MVMAFLLFITLPILDLYLLVRAGEMMGAWWAVLFVMATAVLGVHCVKRAGLHTVSQVSEALSKRMAPTSALLEGLLSLMGGVLLVLPGVMSDVLGVCLLLPPSRALARALILGMVSRHLRQGTVAVHV